MRQRATHPRACTRASCTGTVARRARLPDREGIGRAAARVAIAEAGGRSSNGPSATRRPRQPRLRKVKDGRCEAVHSRFASVRAVARSIWPSGGTCGPFTAVLPAKSGGRFPPLYIGPCKLAPANWSRNLDVQPALSRPSRAARPDARRPVPRLWSRSAGVEARRYATSGCAASGPFSPIRQKCNLSPSLSGRAPGFGSIFTMFLYGSA